MLTRFIVPSFDGNHKALLTSLGPTVLSATGASKSARSVPSSTFIADGILLEAKQCVARCSSLSQLMFK